MADKNLLHKVVGMMLCETLLPYRRDEYSNNTSQLT